MLLGKRSAALVDNGETTNTRSKIKNPRVLFLKCFRDMIVSSSEHLRREKEDLPMLTSINFALARKQRRDDKHRQIYDIVTVFAHLQFWQTRLKFCREVF
jgi:hypothetical protein